MFESARVLNAEDYATTSQPYLMDKVAAAAIAELKRKREATAAAAGPAAPDPFVEEQRRLASETRSRAEQTLAEARHQAEAILAEARKSAESEAARAKEAAYQEGLAQGNAAGVKTGKKKGAEEGQAKYADVVARFEALLASAVAEKEAYFADRESLLVELAIRTAAKVIHREVATRPDQVLEMLRQTVRALPDRSRLVVQVAPADLERLTKAQADGLLNIQGVKQIEFLSDDKIMEGGIRISSGHQTLDAALDTQLAELTRSLLEVAHHDD